MFCPMFFSVFSPCFSLFLFEYPLFFFVGLLFFLVFLLFVFFISFEGGQIETESERVYFKVRDFDRETGPRGRRRGLKGWWWEERRGCKRLLPTNVHEHGESRMNCADNNHVACLWNSLLDASPYRVGSRLVTIDGMLLGFFIKSLLSALWVTY